MANEAVLSAVPLQVMYPHKLVKNKFTPFDGFEQIDISCFESDVENASMLLISEASMEDYKSQPDN